MAEDGYLIVLGAGMSAGWLVDHFFTENRKIVCLKRKKDVIKWDIDHNKVIFVDVEKMTIMPDADHPTNRIKVYSEEYQSEFKGIFYSAIGFRPDLDIVKNVPEDQKTTINHFLYDANLIAPKDVPAGSLMEDYLRWMEITLNLDWCWEPLHFNSNLEYTEGFPQLLKNNISVYLGPEFFNQLENTIIGKKGSLPEVEIIKLFVETYDMVYKPTKKNITIFEREFLEFLSKKPKYDNYDDVNFGNRFSHK